MNLSPDLQRWLDAEKARGCAPEALVKAMIQSGHQRQYAEQVVAYFFRTPATPVSPLSPAQIKEATAQAPNDIRLSDRRIEVLFAAASPRIVLFGNFLSEAECDALIAQARNKMQPALVVDPKTGEYVLDKARVSQATHFAHAENPLIKSIEARIEEVLGYEPQVQEAIQILHYSVGGEYEPHYDYFDPAEPGSQAQLKRGGQRLATLIMYLNNVDAGGATLFPNIGLEAKPQKGHALYFENVNDAGQLDTHTLHAGAPVGQGEKWIATKWLREGSVL